MTTPPPTVPPLDPLTVAIDALEQIEACGDPECECNPQHALAAFALTRIRALAPRGTEPGPAPSLGVRPAREVAETCAYLWGRHAAPELHEQLVDALTLVIDGDRADTARELEEAKIDLRDAGKDLTRAAETEVELTDQLATARAALQQIAEYETNWSWGPAQNVAHLQDIAERALSSLGAPTPLPGKGTSR